MSKKDQKNRIARERPSKNAVIISYYVESSTIQSQQKKMKPNPFHKKAQTTRNRGYDRRAELLTYANELRAADPHKVHLPSKSSRSKPNKWKWSITPARLRVLSIKIFQGRKGRWKYKRMESEEVDPVFGVDFTDKRKKNNSGRSKEIEVHAERTIIWLSVLQGVTQMMIKLILGEELVGKIPAVRNVDCVVRCKRRVSCMNTGSHFLNLDPLLVVCYRKL